ncbi:hypothetical protein [Natronolimnobius baerhuensis]|uniref:Uncharacterized protein n=1 Tax=Natronolimnobius baerhuensis TaxID=253108 RepID=A0A202E976_9EURY|nr:hypothetical protein [Natronolimnobius baerhuensis]OVE84718.1 hypothetical protein B2G88_10055 [Natronolimnobius baerhuensis]
MADDTDQLEERDRGDGSHLEGVSDADDDPTDSFDLEWAERVRIGVSRGEEDLEIGPPREYPNRADIAVRPVSADSTRIGLSIDVMASDYGAGHADVELTPAEARTLRDRLDETVRWMTDTEGDEME